MDVEESTGLSLHNRFEGKSYYEKLRRNSIVVKDLTGAVKGELLVAVVLTFSALVAVSAVAVSVSADTVDESAPTLKIDEPLDGLTTSDSEVTVSGTVTDDVTENQNIDLTINGSSVVVESDGSFSTTVSLEKGTNTIRVTAQDRAGRATAETRIVERVSPTPWTLYLIPIIVKVVIPIIAVAIVVIWFWRRGKGGSSEDEGAAHHERAIRKKKKELSFELWAVGRAPLALGNELSALDIQY